MYTATSAGLSQNGYWGDLDRLLYYFTSDHSMTIYTKDTDASNDNTEPSYWAAIDIPANREVFCLETTEDSDGPDITEINYEPICTYEGEKLYAKGNLATGFYSITNASATSWGDPTFDILLRQNGDGNYIIPTDQSMYDLSPVWAYLDLTAPNSTLTISSTLGTGHSTSIKNGDKVFYQDNIKVTTKNATPGYYPINGTRYLKVGGNPDWYAGVPEKHVSLDLTTRPPLYLESRPVWKAETVDGKTGYTLPTVNLIVNPFFETDYNILKNDTTQLKLYSSQYSVDLDIAGSTYQSGNYSILGNILKNTILANNPFFSFKNYLNISRNGLILKDPTVIEHSAVPERCGKCNGTNITAKWASYCCDCESYNTIRRTNIKDPESGSLFPEIVEEYLYCTTCYKKSGLTYPTQKPLDYPNYRFNVYYCQTCGYHRSDYDYPLKPAEPAYTTTIVNHITKQKPEYCYLTYKYNNNLYKINLVPSSADTVESCSIRVEPIITENSSSIGATSKWVDVYTIDGKFYNSNCKLELTLPSISISAPLDNQSCSYTYSVFARALDDDSCEIFSRTELESGSNTVTNIKNGFTIYPSVTTSNTTDSTTNKGKLLRFLWSDSDIEWFEIEVNIKITIDGITFDRSLMYTIADSDIDRESVRENTDGDGGIA